MTANYAMRLQPLLRRSLSIMTALTTTSPMSNTPTLPLASSFGASSTLHPAAPRPIPLNGVDYRNKVVLAPMVRSGELPSRLLALYYGADLVWGPETVDKSMIGTTLNTNPRTGCLEWTRISSNNMAKADPSSPPKESMIYRIDPAREKGKLIYQIGTSSPTLAVQAASLVAPYVAGIDVNAGCPKPFSTSGGMGAALLQTPDLLASILSALVAEVGTPNQIGISVKIRLLETPERTSSLVHKLCSTGITGLTIHCRTTPMRPRERAIRQQLQMIGDICRSHGVACLMNGDVTSREEGIALAQEYGVDGAMIATAAEANSSVFRPKTLGGLAPWPEVVEQYLHFALSVENKWGNTKFLLSQLMPGKDPRYQRVTMSKSYSECLTILGIDDTNVMAEAAAVDSTLNLLVPKVTRYDIKREKKKNHQNHLQEIQLRKKQQQQQQSDSKPNKRALEDREKMASFSSEAATAVNGETTGKTKKQKAADTAVNAGFEDEGLARGAMAVAV